MQARTRVRFRVSGLRPRVTSRPDDQCWATRNRLISRLNHPPGLHQAPDRGDAWRAAPRKNLPAPGSRPAIATALNHRLPGEIGCVGGNAGSRAGQPEILLASGNRGVASRTSTSETLPQHVSHCRRVRPRSLAFRWARRGLHHGPVSVMKVTTDQRFALLRASTSCRNR